MAEPSGLLTEEEARQQVCPFIRYTVNQVGVLQDRDPAIVEHAMCQGSTCRIAWRWGPPPKTRFMVTPPGGPEVEWSWDPSSYNGERGDYYKDYAVRRVTDPRRGYCGAAGQPGG